ncbi:hypothetical protein BDF20DRAFT_799062, partial [Mycotypha africana]|uniref:uncharacterized protein n=1 Tax=Mycotypha africana TaxID=64632 RepID=UPI002301713C
TASTQSSTNSCRSFWSKLHKLFHKSRQRRNSDFSRQTTGNYSSSTLSDESIKTVEFDASGSSSGSRRHRKQLISSPEKEIPQMIIPPFSPTYAKSNEFPYSNFYVKLPDGRWMIRYRDGNREILRTDILEGYMV